MWWSKLSIWNRRFPILGSGVCRGPRLWAVLLAFGVFSQLAGAAPAGKIFNLRLSGDPETLDWNLAHTPIETHVLLNLMEGLMGYEGTSLQPKPTLAQSFSISADQLTYTFKLRSGVKWSDGVTLRAADFVTSWRRLLSPLTAASYAYLLFDIVGAQEFNAGKLKDFSKVGIRAIDDATFQVTLKKPIPYWIHIPTFWPTHPLREDILTKHGSQWARPGKMVTVGPFSLEAYELDSKVILKANPHYYRTRGNVETVVGWIVKSDASALQLFESGKLDFLTDISTLDLKRLESRPELKTYPYLKTGYLGFNITKYPTNNVHVRKAIAMAIDRSKIGMFLHGGQQAAGSFTPPQMMAHDAKLGIVFDPMEAKRELKRGGLDTTRPVAIELLAPNWDKPLILAQYIQAELKKHLNMDVSLQLFDHKTFRSQLDLKTFPFFEMSWAADYPDPDNFLSVFTGDSGNNRTGWSNPTYDDLVVRARTETQTKQRAAMYRNALRVLQIEDAVILPLYYEPNKALVRATAKGVELNALNYLYLRNVTLP